MKTDYAKQIILNSFNYIVQDVFTHNFIYDDEDFRTGKKEIYTGDLDTPLHSFNLSAGDLRTLIEEFEDFFDIEIDEEKYWANGHNHSLISRKDAAYDATLGMITLQDADIQLIPELTFRDIFNDVSEIVIRKLLQSLTRLN